MKLAIVFDDLVQNGGAEKLLVTLLELWPEAPLYTPYTSDAWKHTLEKNNTIVHTSFIQKLPFARKLNRVYAIFFFHVLGLERFDLRSFDVVLSLSARFAHGVLTRPDTKHICYMNSPGRMLWEPAAYFQNESLGGKKLKPLIYKVLQLPLSVLRLWDFSAAQRVDHFIANAKTPQARIRKYYNRPATIIYPFVDVTAFPFTDMTPITESKGYFLLISRLVAWKHVEIAIEACKELGVNLKIIGDGPDKTRLVRIANKNIEFCGRVSDAQKLSYLRDCSGVIQTQHEDFGIVPLEAMACGKPVIAYGEGGAKETIIPSITGEFFYEQTSRSLKQVLAKFDPVGYDSSVCRKQAEKFDKNIFLKQVKSFVDSVYLA